MTPRTTRLVTALAAIAAIAGCTTTANGTPQADPGSEPPRTSTAESTSSASPTSTKNEAPKVAVPLDASAFLAEPCTSLTSAQLSSFTVNPPGRPHTEPGPGCGWFGAAQSVAVSWLLGNEGGLSDTYRGRELEAYFEPTMVEDYPGVFVDANDNRATGHCGIVVGVSDTLAFYATVASRLDAEGSCALAKQVAAAAIATVKEAN
ncbi:DUF3558 family protein [Actinophytocola sp.]|uniref:DUF3558 family protein n=1 Tax=Actinophytocola sp. TaxID=1872138 RepID=UPI002ED359F7